MSNIFHNLLDFKYSEFVVHNLQTFTLANLVSKKKQTNKQTTKIFIYLMVRPVFLHLNITDLNDTIKLVLRYILANNDLHFKVKNLESRESIRYATTLNNRPLWKMPRGVRISTKVFHINRQGCCCECDFRIILVSAAFTECNARKKVYWNLCYVHDIALLLLLCNKMLLFWKLSVSMQIRNTFQLFCFSLFELCAREWDQPP